MRRAQSLGLLVFLSVFTLAFEARGQLPEALYLRLDEGAGTATANAAAPGTPGQGATLSSSQAWETLSPFAGTASFKQLPTGGATISTSAFFSSNYDTTIEFAIDTTGAHPVGPHSILRDTNDQFGLSLTRTSAGVMQLHLNWQALAGPRMLDFLTPLPSVGWTYVSIVGDSSTGEVRLYYDGDLQETHANAWLHLNQTGGMTVGTVSPSVLSPWYSWTGGLDEVRIWTSVRSREQIRATSYGTIETIDVAMGKVLMPTAPATGCQYYGANETVQVEILNVGSSSLPNNASLQLTLVVDGAVVANEFINLPFPLIPGGKYPHTFATPVDLSALGTHEIKARVTYAAEVEHRNDELVTELQGGGPNAIRSFPHFENFDGVSTSPIPTVPPLGWEVNGVSFTSGFTTPTSLTVPAADHTNGATGTLGNYVLFDPTSPHNGGLINWIDTPCIEHENILDPAVAFHLHNELVGGGTPARFQVEVHNVMSGAVDVVFGPVDSKVSGLPSGWHFEHVDLAAYVQPGEAFFLRFSVKNAPTQVVGLDDVMIADSGAWSFGQPSTPGVALLDVNTALNSRAQSPFLGVVPGPFYKQVYPFRNLGLTIQAIPNSPFMLLSGPFAPAVATFPGVGQMDIGGPLNPTTGIPQNLTVIGDGFNPISSYNLNFYTDANGECRLSASMPNSGLPPGTLLATLQALTLKPTPPNLALSNAVLLLTY